MDRLTDEELERLQEELAELRAENKTLRERVEAVLMMFQAMDECRQQWRRIDRSMGW